MIARIRGAWIAEGVALGVGFASGCAGLFVLAMLLIGVFIRASDPGPAEMYRFKRIVLEWTNVALLREIAVAYLGPPVLAVGLGALGLGLVRKGRFDAGRVSIAGAAARFAKIGVGIGGLTLLAIASLLAALAGVRWYLWG